MKKLFGVLLVLSVVLFIAVAGIVLADGGHKYVGVKRCSMCHKSEAKGNQYGKWLSTAHSKAYEILASPEAQETAKAAGVTCNAQEAPQCLKCHVTGYGEDSGLFNEGFAKEDGIQCESCHGPGSDYAALSVMKDKAQAISAGLVIPTKETCVKCHNPESPKYKEFKFEEFFPKIQHPRPAKSE